MEEEEVEEDIALEIPMQSDALQKIQALLTGHPDREINLEDDEEEEREDNMESERAEFASAGDQRTLEEEVNIRLVDEFILAEMYKGKLFKGKSPELPSYIRMAPQPLRLLGRNVPKKLCPLENVLIYFLFVSRVPFPIKKLKFLVGFRDKERRWFSCHL